MGPPIAATICEASLLRNSLATSPDSPLAEQSLASNHVDDMHQLSLVAMDYPTRGFNILAIAPALEFGKFRTTKGMICKLDHMAKDALDEFTCGLRVVQRDIVRNGVQIR